MPSSRNRTGRAGTHRVPGPRRVAALALATALAATLPDRAQAANCAPTPVTPEFDDLPCMTVVDRSTDPTLTLAYSYDPGLVQMAALGGAQTLSLIAFRSRPRRLPTWLSTDLYQAQKDAYSGGECDIPDAGPEDILETSVELAGEWTLLTPTPLAVTVEQAAAGFTWDTTGMDPGTYHLFAFTDAGRFPAWTIVRGGFTVADDPTDAAASPPGVFLLDPVGLSPIPGQEYGLRGCAFAMPGSELDVEWATSAPTPQEQLWHFIATCLPLEGESIRVPYLLPEETAGAQVQFRATVRDPVGREDSTFTLFSLVAESCTTSTPGPHCDGFEPGDPSSFPDDRCVDPTETTGAGAGGNLTGGCGCVAHPTPGDRLWLLLPLLARRRRRPVG